MPSMLCDNCGRSVTHISVPITPVPELLDNYLLPSTSQTRMIRDTISNTQSHISQIDSDIVRLMASVTKLQTKRVALVQYTQMHRTLIAPIRRLPPEILSEIFLHCMDPEPDVSCFDNKVPRLDKAPLLLAQVDSRWRSIALSTPRLWTYFALTIRPKYLKGDVLLAKTWLGRSGTCPLTISLGSNFQNSMRPLMEVFLLHCERWCNIRLSLPRPVLRSLAAAKNRLPMLQKLSIGVEWDEKVNIFQSAPQLRWVRLVSGIAASMFKIPWKQLKFCDTGTSYADPCLEVLRLASNVEGCTLSPYLAPRNSQSPVQLPHLRSITISGNFSLLDKLLVPELRELSLSSISPWKTASRQLIPLFSRYSLQTLRFIPIFSYHPNSDDVIILLQVLPTLAELDLQGYNSRCMDESFLARFVDHDGPEDSRTPRLVPMLHTLKVDYTPSHFNITAFITAIRLRMTLFALKKVEIRLLQEVVLPLDEPTLSRLQELRDIGLDIACTRVQH